MGAIKTSTVQFHHEHKTAVKKSELNPTILF